MSSSSAPRADLLLYACSAALALGVLPLPYGYFMLLRVTALLAFAYTAYVAFTTRAWPTVVVSVLAMLIFNPVVPLRLSKDVWACIDAGAAAYLAVVTKQIAARFSAYGPPDRTLEAIAKMFGFAVLFGLFAGVGIAVLAGIILIPLKWLGLSISGKFLNPVAYGAASAAAVAVLAGYGYYSGERQRPNGDA